MVPDLQRRFLKPGMPRTDVEQLLGKPDLPKNAYWLRKNDYGFGDEALFVRYDRGDRLVTTEVGATE
jgi:hypothetical protein